MMQQTNPNNVGIADINLSTIISTGQPERTAPAGCRVLIRLCGLLVQPMV